MTHPEHRDFDDSISVVEELDPEPVRERGLGARSDLLLGGLLLLAVLAFAGWQWWQQDYRSGQYHAGQDAAERNDLDSAFRYFSEATGYSNAGVLARSTGQRIAERDRLYSSAVDAAGNGDWLPALRNLQAAARIQPDYKDVAEREEEALRNVYDEAVGGMIVLKESANPPGLYYRTQSRWVWLAGSDARSVVFTQSTDGHATRVVYDAPDLSATATSTPASGSTGKPVEGFEDRRIVTVRINQDKLKYARVPLDPAYFVPGRGGEVGFWAGHVDESEVGEYANPPIIQSLHMSEIVYQLYASVEGVKAKLNETADKASGSAFVAIDPGSNRYLLAEWTGAEQAGSDEDTVINLYIAAAGEHTRRLVYTLRGGTLQSAHISPDGRYVVVHVREEFAWASQSYPATTTTLVDTAEDGRMRILATGLASGNAFYESHEKLESGFVQEGIFAGKLLLARQITGSTGEQSDGTVTTIQLMDPERVANGQRSDYVLTEAVVETKGEYYWRVLEQDEDGLVLLGRGDDMYSGDYGTGALVVLPAEGTAETHKVSIPPFGDIQAATATGCHVIWTDAGREGEGLRLHAFSVYSAHRTREGANEAGTQQVLTKRDARALDRMQSSLRKVNLGEKLFAYALGGDLRAVAYDGKGELLLESGVTAIMKDVGFDYFAGLLR